MRSRTRLHLLSRRLRLRAVSLAGAAALLAALGGPTTARTIGPTSPVSASLPADVATTGSTTLASPVMAAATSTTSVSATATSTEPSSTYSVTVNPQSLLAGAPTAVTVTIKNDAPATNDEGGILYISSATVAIGSLANAAADIPAPGVVPGGSVSVDLTVTVPVGSGTQIGVTTNVTSYSSKPDSGGADNDDTFAPASQTVYIPVQEPTYTLAFVPGLPSYVQESQPFCPVVAVQLLENGSPASESGIPVQLSGIASSASGTLPVLSGSVSTSTNGGIAQFGTCSSGPQIDNLGTFALRASSTSPLVSGNATSGPITVLQNYISCTGSCSLTVTSATTGVSSTVDATGKGTFSLGASFGEGLTPGCASQVNPGPWDPVFITATPGVTGTVTLKFPKEIVNTQSNSGRPHMQVCAQTAEPFRSLDGVASTDGLVADCANGIYPYTPGGAYPLGLCVLSRVKGNLGHETVELLVSDLADPMYW